MENIIFSHHLAVDSTVHFYTVLSPIGLIHSPQCKILDNTKSKIGT